MDVVTAFLNGKVNESISGRSLMECIVQAERKLYVSFQNRFMV